MQKIKMKKILYLLLYLLLFTANTVFGQGEIIKTKPQECEVLRTNIAGIGSLGAPVLNCPKVVLDTTNGRNYAWNGTAWIGFIQNAQQTPSTAIVASSTQVAVPSTNVQGAISDLSTSIKNVETTASNGLIKNGKNFELGQAIGAVGNPAALTSNREIPTNNFQLIVYGKEGFQSRTTNNDYRNFIGGYNNFYYNTTGNYNTGNGYRNFFNNITGNLNTGIGVNNFYSNTSGLGNTGIGVNNFYPNITGSYNTGNGYHNFFNNISGNYNTGIGVNNFYSNTNGLGNTVNGYNNFFNNITGSYNTGNGYNNAVTQTAGDNNIVIGSNCNLLNTTGSNQINIGNTFYKSTTNNVGIFNSNPTFSLDVTGTGRFTGSLTAASYITSSDKNIKDNIEPIKSGLEIINKLNPVTYFLKDEYNSSDEKELKYGFIAQEVQELLPEIVKKGKIYNVKNREKYSKEEKECNESIAKIEIAKAEKLAKLRELDPLYDKKFAEGGQDKLLDVFDDEIKKKRATLEKRKYLLEDDDILQIHNANDTYIALLVKAVKEQQLQIEELKSKIK